MLQVASGLHQVGQADGTDLDMQADLLKHGGIVFHGLAEGGLGGIGIPHQVGPGPVGLGLGDQGRGLLGIIGGDAQLLAEIGRGGHDEAVHHLAVAVQQGVKHALAIHAVEQGLTDAHVADVGGVDEDGLIGDGGAGNGGHVVQGLDGVIILHGDGAGGLLHQVDFAAAQAGQHLGGGHHVEVQVLDPGRAQEIILVGGVAHIVLQVKISDEIGAGNDVGMIEPGIGQQVFPGHVLQRVLGHGEEIASKVVFKSVQGGGPLGGDCQGLVVHHLHAADIGRAGFDEAVVVGARNGIQGQGHVGGDGIRADGQGEGHVLGGDGSAVAPHGILLQLDGEGQVVLSGDAFGQLGHELQLFIELHQGQEHQGHGVFDDLGVVHGQGVQGGEGAGDADVHRLVLRRGKGQHGKEHDGSQNQGKQLFHGAFSFKYIQPVRGPGLQSIPRRQAGRRCPP